MPVRRPRPVTPVALAGVFALLCLLLHPAVASAQTDTTAPDDDASPRPPVRVVVVGLTHTHVHWILGRPRDRGDIEIVGVYEPNTDLAQRYLAQHDLAPTLHHIDLDAMLDTLEPDAACLFGNIFDHLEQTRACATRGVHVMVEKPLAVNLDHAREMAALTRAAGVHLLTNYETSWYPNHHLAKATLDAGDLGPLRRLVVHSGHQGPVEIGCNPEFLDWLTDPQLAGGGALTDFGCYGANLATWLTDNQRPIAVSTVTRTYKPDIYPDVDDDATILIEYPDALAVVQASWNWPHSRKDMALYGATGSAVTVGGGELLVRRADEDRATLVEAPPLSEARNDPFALLAAVVRGDTEPDGLSSLENNLIVTEILDAARRSAETGQRVELTD